MGAKVLGRFAPPRKYRDSSLRSEWRRKTEIDLKRDGKGPLFGAALAGEFEEADDTVTVLGGDGEGGGSVDGVADVGVVGTVVSELSLDGGADEGCGISWVGCYGQDAPV